MSKTTTPKRLSQAEFKQRYPDCPLSYHPPTGRVYKKILGKRHYFGYVDNLAEAIDLYRLQVDDLRAGRVPRQDPDALTIGDLCNLFLEAKERLLRSGDLSQRCFDDYRRTCKRLIKHFGKQRAVMDLRPVDFDELRAAWSQRGWTAKTLQNEITRSRVVFSWGYKCDHLDRPIKFGDAFSVKKATLRKEKAVNVTANGKKLFTRDEIHNLTNATGTQMCAMILLGINCGLGPADLGRLEEGHLDLDAGVLDYPRPKTGIERRAILWPETVAAIRAALAVRPRVKVKKDRRLVFVTKYGQPWHKDTADTPIANEFAKLQRAAGTYRKGRGFYSLRHTFRTVADNCKDQPAINLVMGHADSHISAVYRETISDERLRAVADTVREWLFG